MQKFSDMFTKYLWLIVIVAAGVALAIPSAFTWAASITTIMLQFIMFFMGLTMKPSDFSEILRRPWQVILVALLQFGIMPLSAYLISLLFNLPDQVALGLILVGSVPGGTSSNVVTYLSNGDVPLSVTATSVSTLLAPIFTPLLLSFYAGAIVEVEFWSMFNSMISIVLLPIVLGLVINYFLGQYTEKIEPILPTFSAMGIIVVLVGTVSVNAENILQSGVMIFILVSLHNISGYILGYLGAMLFKLKEPQRRAIAIEVGMQNTGLASSLGLAHFSPLAGLAGAVGAVVHNLIGVIYANIVTYRDRKSTARTKQFEEQAYHQQ